ncbi:MAG: DUF5686 and carboxypeptidase regulatory-like domain-containing protein [Melioribacteraceae bacterium]|nr:DUF5686 and carboxypeptidase regulatory-like domain-containing protein [Melioribacteraceae bacterium]
MKLFPIVFLIFSSILYSQVTSLSGNINNNETDKPISFVNIGVKGTYFGTSSNEFGQFKLALKNGTHNLIFSCVGYETKTIAVTMPNDSEVLINLKPISIVLPEVIVNAEENPAYSIIRKAIENKEKNKEGLLNYHYDFYSKNILKSGKEIIFMEEDMGEGFINLPDDVKEIKTELHHTENISGKVFTQIDLNFLEKKIIDFTNDSITLGKFVFHLPISKFAFDYYDYQLLGIQQSGNRNFYQIKVIPLSDIRPTFKGEILIDDSSYALTNLNLTLENRNLMPFTEFKMSIIQNLTNHKKYWLPKYYNIDVIYSINYYHLITLDSAITSYVKVFNNHAININKSDSLLKNISRIGDTTFNLEPKIITQSKIDSIRLYPLSLDEIKAYQDIDSTKDIATSLKFGGIGGKHIKSEIKKKKNKKNNSFNFGKLFNYTDFQNNRVDGIMPGLKYSYGIADTVFRFSINVGYTLASKDIKANLSFYFPTKNRFFNGIELSGNYGTKPTSVYSHYPNLWNGIAVTLGLEDHFNYYFSKGGTLGIVKKFNKKTTAKLSFAVESQSSVNAIKYYSIFNTNRDVRINPKITNGTDNKIVLNINSGKSPFEINLTTANGFVSQVDFSSKLLGSDFEYARVNAVYKFYIRTIYNELFFAPYLGVFIEATSLFGSYGLQHLYTPQTALSFFSPFGAFKGLQPYQLTGNNSIAIHIEHNWRKTFFDMLGIYFPVAWNLELTTGVSGLGIWNNSNNLKKISSDGYYWEIYGGIAGILGFLNINVAYNKFGNTVVRFELSKFL